MKEETQAKITSAEQNDPKPTPGGAPTSSGSPDDPGNSEETRVAQNEDRAGEKNRAPGVKPSPSELRIAQVPSPAATPAAGGVERSQDGHAKGDRSASSEARQPGQEGALAQPTLSEAEATPEALAAKGAWDIAREQSASNEQAGRQARKKRALPPMRSSGSADLLGLGAAGLSPGGVNLNLSPRSRSQPSDAITLTRARADGERRRSQHAGKWRPVGIERWRSAIENYVPMVKPGNQTALNSARSPFGSYLNQVHQRIHPIFADGFLGSLGQLPSSHPMNRPDLSTNLEIVLDRDEGRVQRLGVTKTSGVTAFDVAALESVHRAQRGMPPREIVSPDGNVFFIGSSTATATRPAPRFARPYILKGQPKSAPPPTPEPARPPDSEAPARHGKRTPARTEFRSAGDAEYARALGCPPLNRSPQGASSAAASSARPSDREAGSISVPGAHASHHPLSSRPSLWNTREGLPLAALGFVALASSAFGRLIAPAMFGAATGLDVWIMLTQATANLTTQLAAVGGVVFLLRAVGATLAQSTLGLGYRSVMIPAAIATAVLTMARRRTDPGSATRQRARRECGGGSRLGRAGGPVFPVQPGGGPRVGADRALRRLGFRRRSLVCDGDRSGRSFRIASPPGSRPAAS